MVNGIHNDLNSLYRLSDAVTRSLSAENPTGGKGIGGMAERGFASNAARELGRGWKVSPYTVLPGNGVESELGRIDGSGAIQHIWMTFGQVDGKEVWRDMILRMYWDGQDRPSVEVPAGDFFANGWNEFAQVTSLAVCVNPARGFNCYWTMPFRTGARITMENRNPKDVVLYYQVDYVLAPVEEDAAYFCAQFRSSDPTQGSLHTVLDGVKGKGQYVGTYMTWQPNNNGWWGEGEFKFYLDGDGEFPTICGTGTEDYFCGAYDFDLNGYREFTGPYTGLPQVLRPDGLYRANTRFGMYRWHIPDPIRFDSDIRVTVQDLGWRGEGRYLPQKSLITSVAYWYQTMPAAPFPALGDRNDIEII